jgi:hypothetical protein
LTDSCQNCRHKVEVATAVAVWVELTEPHCRKFVRSTYDPVSGVTCDPLPCAEAMRTFCGLGDWQPTFWGRVKRAITGR